MAKTKAKTKDRKWMFRISVDKEEKALIKEKADALALTVGAYAKMIFNELKHEEVGIIKDETAPVQRKKPLNIMVELTNEQMDDLVRVSKEAGVYKSEWFRWVLTNIEAELKLRL